MRGFALAAVLLGIAASPGATAGPPVSSITVDYPEDGSLFPPEITPPTFLWRDSSRAVAVWRIDVSFADGSAPIHVTSRGARLRVGKIDPNCVAETNKLPTLTPQQASMRTWVPDAATWARIKSHSVTGTATITVTGLREATTGPPLSRGRVTIRTSKDPVGAPIFYRDVPLMPSETQKGVIKPLAPSAVRLIQWRLRDVAKPSSRVVMEHIPVCANCHSFSADGMTLGMDLDGLQNNKGLYTLTPVAPQTSIGDGNVIQWKDAQGKLAGALRVGFMSRVSPDGRYVVTTIDAPGAASKESPSNYYVANFKDYRFLQVFFPTRGIVSWYSRAAGILSPLPGADDPRFVQTNAVWSPDGRYLVFARARAEEPNPEGVPEARFANDPNERQIQYDLYRIPFNDGKGGTAEPIAGASNNGKSNAFPTVSPDGRWIVFVECRNGLLMRPDSQLFIVPAIGGTARRMRCNTQRMNSWHSFSPNGRWLVFSSKSRSPYTHMYLTHIDEQGNDSPAILIENTTAANRAVNLPEFVNIPADGLQNIGGPAIDYYRLFDRAMYLQKQKQYEASAAQWRKVLAIRPDDPLAQGNLGIVLMLAGRGDEAVAHFQKASELKLRKALAENPDSAEVHDRLGRILLDTGRVDEAATHLRQATELQPSSAPAHCDLGRALALQGKLDEGLAQLRQALELDSRYASAHYNLGLVLCQRGEAEAALRSWREMLRLEPNDVQTLRQMAWLLATSPDGAVRNGSEALSLAVRAVQLSAGKDEGALDALAAAYAEKGQFADAAVTARRALTQAVRANQPARAEALQARVALYDARKPFREKSAARVSP